MDYQCLQYEVDEPVGTVGLNRTGRTAGLGYAVRSPNDWREQRAVFVEKPNPKSTGT